MDFTRRDFLLGGGAGVSGGSPSPTKHSPNKTTDRKEEPKMKKLLTMISAAAVATGAMVPTAAWADKVRVYDVDDYVQDGLVAHFDGIRNEGATAAHSSTTRTWKNLINENNATFSSDSYGSWTEDGLGFQFEGVGKNCYAQLQSGLTFGSEFTVQIAVDVDTSKQSMGKDVYPAYFHGGSYDFGIYSNNKSSKSSEIILKSGYTESKRPSISAWSGKYATAEVFDGKAYLTDSTDSLGTGGTTSHDIVKNNSVRYCWGGSPLNAKRALVGIYYNVRIYERALSLDDLAKNRLVDESRFRNETTKGLLPNVIVVSADGTGANEKYFVSGSETFSAPETVVTRKGAVRRYGYVLETQDGADWGSAFTNLSGSCEIAADSAVRRITWLWTDIMRSYDVDDYVQDGLVLHFDGIRNAGATLAHATSGTKWANLGSSGSAYDATLESWNSNPVNGEWTATGYHFNITDTNTFAAIDTAIDLGTNWTIQLAMTVDIAKQRKANSGVARYPSYLNTYEHNDVNGVWTDNQNRLSSTIVGNFNKHKSTSGNVRPTISNWEGEYVTTMLDGKNGKAYCFQTGSLPASGTSISSIISAGAQRYTWSGAPNGTKQPLVDAIYYSVRMYTNTLDAAQIALNRKIDEARFRGNCDVTVVNGAIGETGTNGESSFPDGCYNLGEGESWTLTAESIVVDGRRYQPRLTVEEKVDGEWTPVRRIWTESYTLNQASLTNPVRLMWTWEKPKGLIIMFR